MPKPKIVALAVVGRDPETGEVYLEGNAHGLLSNTQDGGGEFIGKFEGASAPADGTFSWPVLRSRGHPKASREKNMTRILRNGIAQRRHNVSSAEIAEQLDGRDARTLYRAHKAERGQIRDLYIVPHDDGRRMVAVAFLEGARHRNSSLQGPAWVLIEGEKAARFVPLVSVSI